MIQLLNKARDYAQHGLLLDRLLRQSRRIGIRFFLFYLIQEGGDEIVMPEFRGDIEEYTFGFLMPAEILGWEERNEWKEKSTLFLKRLKKGNQCYCIRHQGKIVAHTWFDFEECKYLDCLFRLNKREVYLFDMYTIPSYRGKNIAPWVRCKCYEILRNMGRDTFYSISDRLNTPAIKFKRKLNAKFLRLYLCIELFKKHRWNLVLRKYKSCG